MNDRETLVAALVGHTITDVRGSDDALDVVLDDGRSLHVQTLQHDNMSDRTSGLPVVELDVWIDG